ncbi:MAG: BrnA antitoxin family protein [Hyphomonadaceae bacterium]|nr:BrnA antitoxin family protein [Hyphomonadaceae bacterium]
MLLSGLLGPAALLRENHAKGTQTRMGRPPLGNAAKKQVTLRLDPEVVDAFKAGGPGWQTRMNEVLAKAVGG